MHNLDEFIIVVTFSSHLDKKNLQVYPYEIKNMLQQNASILS